MAFILFLEPELWSDAHRRSVPRICYTIELIDSSAKHHEPRPDEQASTMASSWEESNIHRSDRYLVINFNVVPYGHTRRWSTTAPSRRARRGQAVVCTRPFVDEVR